MLNIEIIRLMKFKSANVYHVFQDKLIENDGSLDE